MFAITFPISHDHLRYICYIAIGYRHSFVHYKSNESDLYLVDNIENVLILSPEGPIFEGRPCEN